jgi:hypothetical protein
MRRRMMMMASRKSGGAVITALGATVTTFTDDGTAYTVLSWPDAGTYSLVVSADITGDIAALIVAGGGGGHGAGGGAGGFRTHSAESLSAGTYPVIVGAGGAATGSSPSGDGLPSSVFGVQSAGGGFGATDIGNANTAGGSGGSGGGGWRATSSGGAGNTPSTTPPQGFDGCGADPSNRAGAGGGAGGPAVFTAGNQLQPGGPPASSDITGTTVWYARGGPGLYNGSFAPDQPTEPGSGGRGNRSMTFPLPGLAGVVIVRLPTAALGAITT